MSPTDTLKSNREFKQAFSLGRRYNDRFVRICVLKGEWNDEGKVAFVAAKRLGSAPFRNRSKRVLREAARACGLPYKGTHIIVFATQQSAYAPSGYVQQSLRQLLKRAGL